MNPSKIGPSEKPPIKSEIISTSTVNSEDLNVKKTHLRNPNISSANSQKIGLPSNQQSFNVKDPNQTLPFPEGEVLAIDEALHSVQENLDSPTKSLEEYAEERVNVEMDHLQAEGSQFIHTHFDPILHGFKLPLDLVHENLIVPYKNAVEPFVKVPPHAQEIIENVIQPIEMTRTIFQGVKLAGLGVDVMNRAAMVRAAQMELDKRESELQANPTNKSLQSYVKKLRNYLTIQVEILKEKVISFSTSFASVSLRTTRFIARSAEGALISFISSPIGWALSVLDVITEAITYWRAQKAKSTHEAWTQHIAEDKRTLTQAEQLLFKRQERMILRKAEPLNKQSFEVLKAALEEQGIDLNQKQIATFEAFKVQLSDRHFREELVRKFLNPEDLKEETLEVMTRNAIEALSKVKIENEKKFFDFKLNMSKTTLTLACLSFSLSISLEALAIAGIIALSATSMALPGLGFFALGLVLSAVGLYFFYKHKPSLFKCLMQGVNLRLAFFHVPEKIRSLQLIRKEKQIKLMEIKGVKYQQLEGLLKQEKTLHQIPFSKGVDKILQKLEQETSKKVKGYEDLSAEEQMKKIQEILLEKKKKNAQKVEAAKFKEKELNKKLEYWTGKNGVITKLQNQLQEAGNKDFAIANHLVETADGKKINIPSVIVEKIINPEFDYSFDKETLKILKDKMGIHVAEISTSLGKEEKEKILDQLKDFFKMDDSQLLVFMKERLRRAQDKKF